MSLGVVGVFLAVSRRPCDRSATAARVAFDWAVVWTGVARAVCLALLLSGRCA